MSATRTAAKKHVDRRDGKSNAAAVQTFEPKPFKPHRRLFVLLAVVNLIWIVALIVMYFRTVRNAPPIIIPTLDRDRIDLQSLQSELEGVTPTTRPGASDLPSAP